MIATLLTALLATQSAGEAEWNCADPRAQNEMNACAAIDFESADAALNDAWRELIAGAREADREIDRRYDRRPTSEARLREAQRAWLVFRDSHCSYESYESRGGSMEPMLYQGCRAALTRARIRQLTGPGTEQ